MRKSYLKILVIIEAVIFLTSTCTGLVLHEIEYNSDKKVNIESGETYRVVIGPLLRKHRDYDKCQFIRDLSKEEAIKLKEELYSVDNNPTFSSDNLIQTKIDIFKKYQILPNDFNIISISENFSKLIKINGNEKRPLEGNGSGPQLGKTYFNRGPTAFFYLSFLTQTVPIHLFGPPLTNGSIRKIVDIFNITDENLNETLANLTIAAYASFTNCMFIVGGSTARYYSWGFLPRSDSNFQFAGPFFGIYFTTVTLGIYIYEDTRIQRPWLDSYLGFSPILSLQAMISARNYS